MAEKVGEKFMNKNCQNIRALQKYETLLIIRSLFVHIQSLQKLL